MRGVNSPWPVSREPAESAPVTLRAPVKVAGPVFGRRDEVLGAAWLSVPSVYFMIIKLSLTTAAPHR